MIDYGKRELLGVRVDAVDLECALERIMFFARRRRPLSIGALGVDRLVEVSRDPSLRDAVNDLDLVVADDRLLRRALNSLYHLDLGDTVTSRALGDRLLEWCAHERLAVYLYGSTDDTAARVSTKLEHSFGSRLELITEPSRSRSVDRGELLGIAQTINASGASLCFVGSGIARRERFVSQIAGCLDMPALAVSIEPPTPAVERTFDVRRAATKGAFVAGIAVQAARSRLRLDTSRAGVDRAASDFVDA